MDTDLPHRMTTREVCAFARISPATMWRRVKTGRLPRPVDQAREALFKREQVLDALECSRRGADLDQFIEQRIQAQRTRQRKIA